MLKRLTSLLLVAILLLCTCTSALAASYTRILKLDMQGEDVVDMQNRLTYYGYYTGTVDGKFGSGTRKAVIAFQRANNLKVDGKIGPSTWAALSADDSVKKGDASQKFELIEQGDTGSRVIEVQTALKNWYYYNGAIDGVFDAAVKRAVVSFQASTGIKQDGIVGQTTYDNLVNGSASIFQSDAIPRRNMSATLRGYDVYILQQKLNSLNYSCPVDGYYGSKTTAAVKSFQKANGLDDTGKADTVTRRYLWATETDDRQQSSTTSKTLRRGSHGAAVSTIQMRLKAGGFLFGKADGVFGEETEKAVRALQNRFNLEVDGVVGADTMAHIMSIDIGNAEQEVVDPDSGSIGTINDKLKYGDKGAAVKKLQQQLIQIGVLAPGEDDGVFGRKTRQAVRTVQKNFGVKVDGIVGTKTVVAINYYLGVF